MSERTDPLLVQCSFTTRSRHRPLNTRRRTWWFPLPLLLFLSFPIRLATLPHLYTPSPACHQLLRLYALPIAIVTPNPLDLRSVSSRSSSPPSPVAARSARLPPGLCSWLQTLPVARILFWSLVGGGDRGCGEGTWPFRPLPCFRWRRRPTRLRCARVGVGRGRGRSRTRRPRRRRRCRDLRRFSTRPTDPTAATPTSPSPAHGSWVSAPSVEGAGGRVACTGCAHIRFLVRGRDAEPLGALAQFGEQRPQFRRRLDEVQRERDHDEVVRLRGWVSFSLDSDWSLWRGGAGGGGGRSGGREQPGCDVGEGQFEAREPRAGAVRRRGERVGGRDAQSWGRSLRRRGAVASRGGPRDGAGGERPPGRDERGSSGGRSRGGWLIVELRWEGSRTR